MKGNVNLSQRFILITGCSGGGKSTLLDALNSKGFNTIAEPGRRVVAAARAGSGKNLPWVDMKAFAHSALELALSDLESARNMSGTVFFDRGVIDAAVALQAAGGETYGATLGQTRHYATTVFLAPPWFEIFVQDADRRHGFDSALAEYDRIEKALDQLGYCTSILPKAPVEDRAAFVLDRIADA